MREHPRFRLRTFGGLVAEETATSAAVLGGQRKALALLALLAAAGDRGIARERIVALFWPEQDARRAPNALSQLLHRVRRELGASAIVDSGLLSLNSEVIASDCRDFSVAISVHSPQVAVELYGGPFLDGFYLRDADDFERWSSEERQRFERWFHESLDDLTAMATAEGDHTSAVRWSRRRAESEPLNERAALKYVETLVRAGDRELATDFVAKYTTLVRSELGTEPNAVLIRLLTPESAPSAGNHPLSPPELERSALPSSVDVGKPATPARIEAPTTGARGARVVFAGSSRRWFAVLGAAAIAATAVVLVRKTDRAPSPTEPLPVVLVAPFDVPAGDTVLAQIGRLAQLMVIESAVRSGVVGVVDGNLVEDSVLDRTGRVFEQSDTKRLTSMAARARVQVIVHANFYRRGDSLDLRANIIDGRSGRVLRVVDPVAYSVNAAASPALQQFSSRVLGSLASIVDARIADVLDPAAPAPNLEAYQAYVSGIDAFIGPSGDGPDYVASSRMFERATTLDPGFDLASVWLVFSYAHRGLFPKADSIVKLLGARRERLAPLERFAVDYFVAWLGPLGIARCHTMYEAASGASRLAPNSNWTYVVGYAANCLGHFDEAAMAFRQLQSSRAWITRWVPYWIVYSATLHEAERYDDEFAILDQGILITRAPRVLARRVAVLGAKGDVPAIDRLMDSLSRTMPGFETLSPSAGEWFRGAAREASVHEHSAAARQLADRCVAAYRRHAPQAEVWRWADCEELAGRFATADSLYVAMASFTPPNEAGELLADRATVALERGDSATFHRLSAQLYALPAYAPGRPERLDMDAVVATLQGDFPTAADKLQRLWFMEPTVSHDNWRMTPALRRTPEMQWIHGPR